MSKFFQTLIKPTSYKINKGNVKLVREEVDYFVKYPDVMEGHVHINQVGENIDIMLTKDFPGEKPVVINLNNLQTCKISLESGVINSEAVCPNMKVRVNSGTLSANISKHNMASVKADVDTGVLNNHSNLAKVQSNDGMFGNFMNMGFMQDMGIGFNNHIELMGNGTSHATFEVGSGTMDLSS